MSITQRERMMLQSVAREFGVASRLSASDVSRHIERKIGLESAPCSARALLLQVLWQTWADLYITRHVPEYTPRDIVYPIGEMRAVGYGSLHDEVRAFVHSAEFDGMCDMLGLDASWVRRCWQPIL